VTRDPFLPREARFQIDLMPTGFENRQPGSCRADSDEKFARSISCSVIPDRFDANLF
jgi:hypothetical protein